jgi:N-acyl-D-amino-acid deacylase
VFDPDTLRDTSTYDDPISYPVGVHYVAVNGTLVVDDNQTTGATPGRALRDFWGRTAQRMTEPLSGVKVG